jgi:hypothetical protein
MFFDMDMKTSSLTLGEENRFRVLEKRLLEQIFGSEKNDNRGLEKTA